MNVWLKQFGFTVNTETGVYIGAAALLIVIYCIYLIYRKSAADKAREIDNKLSGIVRGVEKNETLAADKNAGSETGPSVDAPETQEQVEKLCGQIRTLEKRTEAIYAVYPHLKIVGKLEDSEALNLTDKEISEHVSALLKTVRIVPEALDPRTDEKKDKRLNDHDMRIIRVAAGHLNGAEVKFGRNIGEAQDYLVIGNAEFYEANYRDAAAYYDSAIAVGPGYAYAWNNKGVALAETGMREEALRSFDRAIELMPTFAEARYGMGFTLDELGRHEEALRAFDDVVEINPLYAEAWYDRGFTLSSLGRHEEALKSFDNALALKPQDAKAWHGKGIALSCLGMHEDAYKSYDNAVAVKPDDDEAWYGRGIALNYLGLYEEAVQSFSFANAIRPDNAKSWNGKGIALSYLGRLDDALGAFDTAISVKPDSAKAWYNRSRIYALKGEKENMLRNLSRAGELDAGYRDKAARDEDFKNFRDDDEFRNITG